MAFPAGWKGGGKYEVNWTDLTSQTTESFRDDEARDLRSTNGGIGSER